MKNCHNMYLKCDVLLLADVFKKFRKSNLKNHELCPSHYFRAPTLSWDVMLNITKVGLNLISDAGKYLFFEKVEVERKRFLHF